MRHCEVEKLLYLGVGGIPIDLLTSSLNFLETCLESE